MLLTLVLPTKNVSLQDPLISVSVEEDTLETRMEKPVEMLMSVLHSGHLHLPVE